MSPFGDKPQTATTEDFFNAVRKNDVTTLNQFLLRGDVNVDCKDGNGETALYYACLLGFSEIAHLLVANGAEDDIQRRCYHNALDKAGLPAALRFAIGQHKRPKTKPPPNPENEGKTQQQIIADRRDKKTAMMLQSAKRVEGQTHIFLKCMKWSTRWIDFFKMMEDNTVAVYLDIRKSRIGPAAAAAMSKCLHRNCHLTEIFMYKNEIGDTGVEALCHALTQNNYLTKLNLCDNLISAAGAKCFAELLCQPQCVLMQLDLNRNSIGDVGSGYFADALRHNTVLCALSLRANDITEEGGQCFQEALQHNTTLELLYLQENDVPSMTFDAVSKACANNLHRKGFVYDNRERCAELCDEMFARTTDPSDVC